MDTTLEINTVIAAFAHNIQRAIDAEVKRQVGQMIRETPVLPTPEKKRGPKEGSKAVAKPCPVTGVPNTHRRFSYLMPEVRTPENLAKYKRGGK